MVQADVFNPPCSATSPRPAAAGYGRALYFYRMFRLLLYVFPFFVSLCYDTVVPRERDEKKRKKETIMKKISVLLEKLYATFIHGRG